MDRMAATAGRQVTEGAATTTRRTQEQLSRGQFMQGPEVPKSINTEAGRRMADGRQRQGTLDWLVG